MPDRQLLEWEWEWECGNGRKGSFGREGSVQRLKRERGGPNCSTSQTSDRRTILAQLRHPKVRKHTPAPLEPPPASTNAVGRVTTSTKKDLGDALISLHLQFTRTNQKRPRTTLPTPPSFPPSPPPAPAPTLTHQRPAALPHPARPKSVRETRAGVSSRGHSQHKTTAPPPHRLSRVLSFLDLSLSLSLHPQTTPRVSPSSPFDTPPPYKRTQPPSWATPTPTSSRSTRSASWLCVLPLIPQQFLAASPRPAIPLVLLLCPTINGGAAKKRDNGVLCIEPRQCAGWDEDAVNGMRSCSPFSCHRPMPPHMPTPATQARQCKKPRRAPMPAGSR